MYVGRSVSVPMEIILKENYVNRCKVTSFCVIKQFWKRFEATSLGTAYFRS
jgi:hypothetical protein